MANIMGYQEEYIKAYEALEEQKTNVISTLCIMEHKYRIETAGY